MKLLFGREPAVFFGMLAAILLAVIMLLPWSAEINGTLNAAVVAATGLATALVVDTDKLLPALTGLVQAVLAVIAAFGTDIPANTQAGILALIAAAAAFFVRSQVDAKLMADGKPWSEAYPREPSGSVDPAQHARSGRHADGPDIAGSLS